MNKLTYPALFSKNEDGGYTVEFPDLPGCITFGKDLADTLLMAQDAACGWVLDELEDEKLIPRASDPFSICTGKDEFISMMVLDIDKYSRLYGKKCIRKNTTIPSWLNTFAEKRKINYSQVLTDALLEMYFKEI